MMRFLRRLFSGDPTYRISRNEYGLYVVQRRWPRKGQYRYADISVQHESYEAAMRFLEYDRTRNTWTVVLS